MDAVSEFLAWALAQDATRRLFGGALLFGLVWPSIMWAWNWRRY